MQTDGKINERKPNMKEI